jgi:hypothetical protein
MSNRIAAANVLLKHSRAVLAAFENGRRAGMALAGAPAILPVKPVPERDETARPGFAQQHRGN